MIIKFEELAKASSSNFKKLGELHTQMAKAHGEQHAFMKGKSDAAIDEDSQKQVMSKTAAHHETMEACHKAAAQHCEECAKSVVVEMTKAFAGSEVDAAVAAATATAAADAAKTAAAAPAAAIEITKCAHDKPMAEACSDCKREVTTVAKTTSDGVSAMIEETKNALVKQALESMTSDPEVKKAIQEMVLKGVRDSLGDKTVPTRVQAVHNSNPYDAGNNRLVPRPGAPAIDTNGVDPQFAHLVEN